MSGASGGPSRVGNGTRWRAAGWHIRPAHGRLVLAGAGGQEWAMPDEPDVTATTQRTLPLGVLFVHGMGSAAQGTTLRQHGEPLVDWLAGGTQVFERAELVEVDMTPGDAVPARMTCELFVTPGGREPLTRWILAESHWTDTFKPATYLRIAVWLICSVPWMLGEYAFNALARERTRRTYRLRPLLIPLYAVAGSVLAGPIVVLLALLVPAQYAPLKMIRDWGGKLPRALAASLGDVYVILATHVDREAIRARIVRDHEWLKARCERTVIVAHSAGSALTHQLIRDERITGVDAYVTLGEAIWRMQWMRQLSAMPLGKRLGAIALALLGFALWVAAIALAVWQDSLVPALLMIVPIGLAHAGSAWLVWRERDAELTRESAIDRLVVDGTPRVARWRDYVGSSDPVPGGVLYDARHDPHPVAARAFYEPRWLRNCRSMVLDHVTYPHNLEEYVAGLGADLAATDARLAALVEARPLVPARTATLAQVGRALRTLALALSRVASGAVVVATLAVLDGAGLRRLGERVDWVAEMLTQAVDRLPLGGLALDPGFALELTGAGVVAGLLAAAWVPVALAWRAWDAKDRRRFMLHRPPVGVDDPRPLAELPPGDAGPRAIDALFATWWLLCSGAAVALCLVLAEELRRGWLPAGVLLVGAALVLCVRLVARQRDNAYGPPAAAPAEH